MKIVSYVCREGEDLKFLYVDGDFDSSKISFMCKGTHEG